MEKMILTANNPPTPFCVLGLHLGVRSVWMWKWASACDGGGEGYAVIDEVQMIEVAEKVVREDGYEFLKLLSVSGDEIRLERFLPAYILKYRPWEISVVQKNDDVLGVVVTEVLWPVLGPVFLVGADGAARKFFCVHRRYGRSVSDCVRLAVEGWRFAGRVARHGFVRSLPAGVEEGREALGVSIHSAEWMMNDAVAVM